MSNLQCILVIVLTLVSLSEGARRCYSGSKNNYQSRICGLGESDDKYVCQKFVCEGGKSPFELRTCATKNTGCIAGPAICRFSHGTGSCQRCDKDNCNA